MLSCFRSQLKLKCEQEANDGHILDDAQRYKLEMRVDVERELDTALVKAEQLKLTVIVCYVRLS